MLRRNSRSTGRKQRRTFTFEALEPRAMMSASTNSMLVTPPAPPAGPTMEPMLTVAPITKAITPLTPATTTGPFNPLQIRQIYGLTSLSLNGAGTTIAIVDAFNDPTIVQDLHTFDQEFSLPMRSLRSTRPRPRPYQHEVGPRNRARRGMGPCHRAGRQHFARRGQAATRPTT